MLKPDSSYRKVYTGFQWHIPEHYNIGVDICDKHAGDRQRTALICEQEDGHVQTYTFHDLRQLSNRLANTLKAHGMQVGDRLGILLPQCLETAIAHIATYKTGGGSPSLCLRSSGRMPSNTDWPTVKPVLSSPTR